MGGRPQATSKTYLATTISADALAVGESTRVSGTITATTKDVGPVTLSSAKAVLTATAQSTDGSTVYAAADTSASADGADLVISRTHNSTGTDDSGGLTTMTATSTTSLFALNLEHVDLPFGTISVGSVSWHDEPCVTGILDGNVASLDASAQASGETTLAQVDFSVLTTDDISCISAAAITIA